MLPGKTTPPAGASFLLAGNKPASPSPSVLSTNKAPAVSAGGVVLAMDGKCTMAASAAVVGRDASFSGGDLEPKELSGDVIKKVAEETSSLLGGLRAPKDSSLPEQASFSKEVETVQKVCDFIVEGAGFFHEDKAMTMLIGVQARINLLLNADNKQSPQDFLLSSMGQIKAKVEDHMSAQASGAEGRMSFYDMVQKSPLVQPTPTVCSDDEVKLVLSKTLALLESTEPVHSTTGMSGLFFKLRSNCRALAEDVQKHGVDDKTGSAISLIHVSALFVLGMHKKHFSYDDAADDSLMSSLRRLEVALRDYTLGGPSAEGSD